MFGQGELPTAHFALYVLQPPLRTNLTGRKVTTLKAPTLNTATHPAISCSEQLGLWKLLCKPKG